MGRFRQRRQVVEAPEPDDDPLGVPARFNFTRDVVEAAAVADPLRSAMTFVDREGIIDRRTFKEVANDASRWASLLGSQGLEPGDRVVVLVDRRPVWHSVILGALKAGFVVVPCPETFDGKALTSRAKDAGARVVVTDRAHATAFAEEQQAIEGLLVVEELREELRSRPIFEPTHDTAAGDPAFILYTSGTTGRPKGVVHTHGSAWAARLQAEEWLNARKTDLVWCTHGTGSAKLVWNGLLGPWSCGAEIAVHEGSFNVEERFDLISRLGVTILCQPASEYRQMADHSELEQFYTGSIRHAVSTGEPLDPGASEAFRVAFGLTIYNGYGQTENTILVASTRNAELKVGSLGLPILDHEIRVIDDAGNEQPPGVEGEIALRGRPPSLFDRYWNDPDETEAAFLGEWYLTGDRATQDDDGYLWFVGRANGERAMRRSTREHEAESATALAAAAAAQFEAPEESGRSTVDAAVAAPDETELRVDEEEQLHEQERGGRDAEDAAAAANAEWIAAAEAARIEAIEAARRGGGPAAPQKPSRREEARAKRAAKAQARADEQQRKADKKRLREEEEATADKARRDEAKAQRAAGAASVAAATPQPATPQPATPQPATPQPATPQPATPQPATPQPATRQPDEPAADEEEERFTDLIARLRAYGHGDDSGPTQTPPK